MDLEFGLWRVSSPPDVLASLHFNVRLLRLLPGPIAPDRVYPHAGLRHELVRAVVTLEAGVQSVIMVTEISEDITLIIVLLTVLRARLSL